MDAANYEAAGWVQQRPQLSIHEAARWMQPRPQLGRVIMDGVRRPIDTQLDGLRRQIGAY